MPLGEVGGRTDCDPASSSLHEGAAPTLERCGSSSATTAVTPASRGSSTSLRHVPPTRSRTRGGSGSSTPCAMSTRSSARRRSAGPRPSSSCSTGTIATAPRSRRSSASRTSSSPTRCRTARSRRSASRVTMRGTRPRCGGPPHGRSSSPRRSARTSSSQPAERPWASTCCSGSTPPRDALGRLEPEHVLVGHGRGLHGPAAAAGLRNALEHSRAGLPRLLARVPGFAADAIRRRRKP